MPKLRIKKDDDIVGVVHSVGSEVVEFRADNRIAAFHRMWQPGGNYAEYAVNSSHATFHTLKKTVTTYGPTLPLPCVIAIRSKANI